MKLVAILSALMGIAATLPSRSTPLFFEVKDLGSLGGIQTTATALNDSGLVVGYDHFPNYTDHAFIYADGRMIDLHPAGAYTSEAAAINNSGTVLIHGGGGSFLYQDGQTTDLGDFGFNNSWIIFWTAFPTGLNDSGAIVGHAGQSYRAAFVYQNGAAHYLPVSGWSATFFGINNSGTIVGVNGNDTATASAFLYQNGIITNFGVVGADHCEPHALNNSGQVVGSFAIASNIQGPIAFSRSHAFLYKDGQLNDLGTLPGCDSSSASAISDSGVIVGTATGPPNVVSLGGTTLINSSGTHAFVYADGTMYDLNDLIAPGSGWMLEQAVDVNSSGLIVGNGTNPQGQKHAFLLTPANPPTPTPSPTPTPTQSPTPTPAPSPTPTPTQSPTPTPNQSPTPSNSPTINATALLPRPQLVIKGSRNFFTSRSRVKIQGTVLGEITAVTYRTQDGPNLRAHGTASWFFWFDLKPGLNTVNVWARGSGDSRVRQVTVFRR